MNKSTLSLCFFASLFCNASCSAAIGNNTIQLTAKENDALSVFLPSKNAAPQWIDANENQGLFLPASEIPDVPLKMGGLSSVTTNNGSMITTFNVDTQNIQLWQANGNAISELEEQRFSIGGIETLCIGKVEGKLQTFVIDDLGMLHQFAMINGSQPTAIRRFAIGPGIKSCAVDSTHSQIWLADESAGIWTLDARAESEISRELYFTHPDYAFEGVASTTTPSAGQVSAWVSPDISGIWINTHCNNNFVEFDTHVAPEMLTLGATSSGILMSIYDDDSGQVFNANYPLNCEQPETHTSSVITLLPTAETTPVTNSGDAADDPAIWVNSTNPEQSLILGTNKKGGLAVYDLNGEEIAWHPVGRVNNVDVRYNLAMQGELYDIAVASNRTLQSMSVFLIARSSGALTHISNIKTSLSDVYGFCLFDNNGTIHGLINDTSGQYEQYELSVDESTITGTLVHSFTLPSQPEGCVVDDATGIAFLGEEGAGIWRLDLNIPQGIPEKVIATSAPVEADIEGLGLYWVDDKQYIIASSQGNNQYAVYQAIVPYELLGMVEVSSSWDSSIDGVSETDGLDITNADLGGQYKDGIFVVQDGRNVMPSDNQNFKFVDGTQFKHAIRMMRAKQ